MSYCCEIATPGLRRAPMCRRSTTPLANMMTLRATGAKKRTTKSDIALPNLNDWQTTNAGKMSTRLWLIRMAHNKLSARPFGALLQAEPTPPKDRPQEMRLALRLRQV